MKKQNQILSDSSWNVQQPQFYEVRKFLDEDQINRVIQNLKKCKIQEAQLQLCFKSQHALKKFWQVYEQQMIEQGYINSEEDDLKQLNKFRRLKDWSNNEYDMRRLRFDNFRFLNIFMKIYQSRLKQMQTEYHYRFHAKGVFLEVYYTKNEKISSFFKNEIFEMKTKLNLFYCHDLNVIQKIKFSNHFNKLIESKQIAAEYFRRNNGIECAVFHSNSKTQKQIIQVVNQNLLQHATLLELFDWNLNNRQMNRIFFKLIVSFLLQTFKIIEKEQEIIVQANNDRCCILVHDRHECHVDAKNQILEKIGQLIFFRLEGKDMRTLYNKVIKNHRIYPYLRVKYKYRSLHCVFSQSIFHSYPNQQKNVTSFCQLFKEYFQTLNEDNKLIYYLKNLNYPNFIGKVSELTENSNVAICNFEQNMVDDSFKFSKIVLGVKSLIGMESVVQSRKCFYEVFLKLMLRFDFVDNIVKNMKISPDSFSNILGLSKPSTILPHETSSMMSQEEFKKQFQALNFNNEKLDQSSQLQNSVFEELQVLDGQQKQWKTSHERPRRQKKVKHIDLQYPFKQPEFHKQLSKFWNLAARERKFQKKLIEMYPDPFSKSKFKTFALEMRQKIILSPVDEIQQEKIFLSTIIERHNVLANRFINLIEFKKLEKESKLKEIFVFYKLKNQEVYIPSYVLQLMS